MTQRTWAVVAAAVIVSVMFNPDTARSQSAETGAVQQTAWGRPDLQGVWDFRTITPMERPEELGDQAFLTAEEAANLEQEVVDRNARLLNEAINNFVFAIFIFHWDIQFFLQFAHFLGYSHALLQKLNDLLVEFIYLLPEFKDTFIHTTIN